MNTWPEVNTFLKRYAHEHHDAVKVFNGFKAMVMEAERPPVEGFAAHAGPTEDSFQVSYAGRTVVFVLTPAVGERGGVEGRVGIYAEAAFPASGYREQPAFTFNAHGVTSIVDSEDGGHLCMFDRDDAFLIVLGAVTAALQDA